MSESSGIGGQYCARLDVSEWDEVSETMEECCNGGSLFICERYKVVEVVILHGAFHQVSGSMENDFNHSVDY
jgi:hypothetical protein